MLLDFTTPKGIILPRIRRALSYFVDWHSLLFGTMDIPPFERYLLIHLLPDKDSFPILSGHFHAFHKRSLRCYTFGTPSTRGHAYSIPVWVYAGLCYLPRVIPVRTFPGLAILCRGFSATLPNPGRVGTDNLQPFRISESGDFVGKAKLARLSVGILCPVPARLWLFSILAQLCGFVKNFFRTSEIACCRNCNRFPAFRLSVGILCPVQFAVFWLRG